MIKITMLKKDILEKISKVECSIKDVLSFYTKDGYLVAETVDNELASCVRLIELNSENISEQWNVRVSPIMLSIIKKMPDGDIDIAFNNDEVNIKACDKCISSIKYIGIEKAHVSFELDNANEIMIPNLKNILKKVLISAAKKVNDFKSGINIVSNGNKKLFLQATDSFRLSRVYIESTNDIAVFNITIPGSTLLKIINVTTEDNITLKYTKNSAIMYDENAKWALRLFESKYPDVERVIPKSFNNIYKVNKNELLDALDRCSIYNDLLGDIVKLEFNNNNVMVSKSCEMGNYSEPIDIINDNNDKLIINVSNKYLSEALKTFDGTDIMIKANGVDKPVCMYADNNDELLQLILPIRIRD